MHDVFIALGSNLGKRQLALRSALERLAKIPGTRLIAAADFVRTAPVDAPQGSPEFLNSAAHLQTSLSARDFLNHLLAIERDLGRQRDAATRNAPRPIDLDLLLFDRQVIAEPNLSIPHPRMHLRRFVLAPLSSIAPGAVHPVLGKSVRELLADLDAKTPAAEINHLGSSSSADREGAH